jgi:hypothetical protein
VLAASATLRGITPDFVSELKRHRCAQADALGTRLSSGTLNQDLAAIGALFTWYAEVKGLSVPRPKLRYQRESRGRMRNRSSEELAASREHCAKDWHCCSRCSSAAA